MTDPTASAPDVAAMSGDPSLPASRAFLAVVRLKVPGLSIWTDQALLDLAADVALLSYARVFPEVWRLGRGIGLDDLAWATFCHEVLHGVYPVAFSLPHLPEEEG